MTVYQATKQSSPHLTTESTRSDKILARISHRFLKSVLNLNWDERHHVEDPQTFAQGLTWRVLTLRPMRRVAIIILSIGSAVCGLAHPWVQKLFVDTLVKTGASDTARLLALITAAFLAMLGSLILTTAVRAVCGREGSYVNAILSRALYRQTLALTATARSGRTVGETVNFYAQDVGAAGMLVEEFLSLVISSFVPIILAPLFVIFFLDMPLAPVLITMLVLITFKALMSWRQSGFFREFKSLASDRLSVVNEWLQNIRIIRILGWTSAFEKAILEKRKNETINRLGMVTNGSTMNSIAQVAPLLINAVGIASLVHFRQEHGGNPVTPGEIFALLWIFGVFLARPLRMMPWTLVFFLDGYTSCKRLEHYFQAHREDDMALRPQHEAKNDPGALYIEDMNLTLGGRKILDHVSLEIPKGAFVVITGEVGSGKTQLLLSLLRESPATFGAYRFDNQDALSWSLNDLRALYSYVPQDGFVMSGTLLENVKFLYDPERTEVEQAKYFLRLADFEANAEGMANGLDTEIGERGVNLSGGQRQRVSLARSVYHDRPIILLDDCLSAVDTDTEAKLIDQLICGAWKNKTRILVTHRLSVIKHADIVYELKNGSLIQRGGGKRHG